MDRPPAGGGPHALLCSGALKHDRVTELYEGTWGSPAGRDLTRRRVHWLCGQVEGSDVLDVGCSQGLASILLGREGRRVTGLDVQQGSLDFALARLGDEEPEVAERVRFVLGNAAALPFEDATFDTVLLGEVIEHLIDIRTVLAEVARVLCPGGKLVLTTPYGLFPSDDHKEPLYLEQLLELLSADFGVDSLELIDRFVGIVALAGAGDMPPEPALRAALRVAEERLRVQDAAVEANRLAGAAADERLAEQKHALTTLMESRKVQFEARSEVQATVIATLKQRVEDLNDRLQERGEAQATLITALKQRVEAQAALITTLKQRVEAQATLITTLKQRVEAQAALITTLKQRVKNLREKLQERSEALRDKVEQRNAELAAAQDRLGQRTAELTGLRGEVARLREELAKARVEPEAAEPDASEREAPAGDPLPGSAGPD